MKFEVFTRMLSWAALLHLTKCDAVCDKATLIQELKQDLADNDMLDCLRVIHPPHGVKETPEMLNKRLAA